MNYTEKIIKFQTKYGIKTKRMAYILGVSVGTFRNYKSKHLFKRKHYDLICKYLENLQFEKRKF